MSYRNANYSAFYVSEPFSESNLGANSTHDFVYYNMLRMWRGEDNSFPFNDAHDKTYNVRDGSDWEKTLKPRLHTRLEYSNAIVHAFQGFRAPFSGKIVHIFPEQSAAFN